MRWSTEQWVLAPLSGAFNPWRQLLGEVGAGGTIGALLDLALAARLRITGEGVRI